MGLQGHSGTVVIGNQPKGEDGGDRRIRVLSWSARPAPRLARRVWSYRKGRLVCERRF